MPGYELFDEAERREVQEVLETGIFMRYGFDAARRGRWKARELEAELCRVLGSRYALLTSSGTSALTTALAALGIGAGDEIILPTFTFVASFEAVLSVGAIPVLADVDDTMTLAPDAVRQAITPRTKAIMPVHMCGAAADLDALAAICRERRLVLFEDACQAIGARYKGRAVGTIGQAGAFSFDFVKTITCAEGGAIVTDDEALWRRCDGYADHGHDHLGADRGADQHQFLGYNCRISELHAAVGLAQIRKLPRFLEIQRRNKQVLKEALAGVPGGGVSFRRLPDATGDNASFLTFFLPEERYARAAVPALRQAGLVAMHWYDNNWHYFRRWDHLKSGATLSPWAPELRQAMARYAAQSFPASDAWMSRAISTPIGLAWSEAETRSRADRLITAVRSALD